MGMGMGRKCTSSRAGYIRYDTDTDAKKTALLQYQLECRSRARGWPKHLLLVLILTLVRREEDVDARMADPPPPPPASSLLSQSS